MGDLRAADIVQYIPEGRENGISRKELAARCGVHDRQMRQLIETARVNGVPIINLQDGAGYYISYEPEDIKAQYLINQARARAVLLQQSHLRKRLRRAGVMVD